MGVCGILLFAVFRLSPIAIEPLSTATASVLALYAASIAFFAYTEGYRAFQRGFSPRVAARAHYLRRAKSGSGIRHLFAPLFCMGFFGASRRRIITTWALTGGIVLLIAAVKLLPQPWRGAVDAGVVVALLYGAVCIMVFFAQGFTRKLAVSDDVPKPSAESAPAPRRPTVTTSA